MILLTGFYEDADPRRHGEFLECVRRNAANGRFDELHLFVEQPGGIERLRAAYPPLAGPKVRLIAHGRRVTYADLFAYASRHLAGRRVIVANADIYFDDTLAQLDGYDLAGRLLCLSRWDVQPDSSAKFFEQPASQDAWIFQAPLPAFPCDFHLGLPGCDNRLAWEADHAGLAISNPARSLRAYHLHLSYARRYADHQRLVGPMKAVPAVFLATPYLDGSPPEPDVACASVAFRETMGYTIARLEPGVSSHNNESRPFTAIPEPLVGRPFTQVVAYAVSPVHVEFLTSGRLYVLVGNDWEGYHAATAWLSRAGSREGLPLVETQCGVGFEVWSLVAEAGERFVIPTQVMLVADRLVRDDGRPHNASSLPQSGGAVLPEVIFALTSLSPAQHNVALTQACIKSWRDAGLQVRVFNHPGEIPELAKLYDLDFVPVAETTAPIFGKHLIPIKTMLDWAAKSDAPALLINSDIDLRMAAWELKRARWISDGGLCYFIRHNRNGDTARAQPEPYSIDAILLHGRDAALFPDSFLSMGQPFWDYWLPHTFAAHGRPIHAVEFPAALHLGHKQHWSRESWHRCALEFARVSGESSGDQSFEACQAMSMRVLQDFDRRKLALPRLPPQIQEWVQQRFGYPGPKLFIELGAHRGTDTVWMAEIPSVVIHAFEPDPRNHQPPRPNVTLHRAAIADRDGRGSLMLSQHWCGQEWTYSSSIKPPKNHLHRFPVTFGGAVEVPLVTLDTFYARHGLEVVDFIWADIQGAEGEMIRGGRRALARTRYLYTEYSDDELYEQQATLKEMLEMLPSFRVLELWPEEVLLENRDLQT
jgi:FkbM family methyltransferase